MPVPIFIYSMTDIGGREQGNESFVIAHSPLAETLPEIGVDVDSSHRVHSFQPGASSN